MPYKSNRLDPGLRRAALYARVSTEDQAMHGVSLDAQKERLRQFAKENALEVVDLYVDDGISARKRYTRRPEMLRLLSDVQAGKIDVILFIKLDRWFRNIADYYEVQTILDRHRVQWIATEEDYDTTTANGRLSLNIKLAIAQDEADRTSERIRFVFQNMVKEGRVISGSTPKGYRIQDKHVVVDESTVDIVRDMFRKIIECRSMKATSHYLVNQYGVFIDLKSMRNMVRNTMYIGEAHGVKDWCPAIIDRRTFDLANQIADVRSARYDGTRSDRVYLFTGLVFCGCCGRRMTTYACRNKNADGSTRQTFIYYRCSAHIMRLCEMTKQFNQDRMENWLLDNILFLAEKYNLDIDRAIKRPRRTIDAAKVRAKIEKLKDLYLNDLIPRDIYARDYQALSDLLADAERQEEPPPQKIDTTVFENLRETYAKLSMPSRKAFWSEVIQKIVVTKDGDFIVTLNQS